MTATAASCLLHSSGGKVAKRKSGVEYSRFKVPLGALKA